MKEYKYKTKESDTISLHDNFIEKIIIEKNIIIEMDGFDITKENEHNKTGKHKFAENTCIILVNGNYIKGLFSYTIENNGSTHYQAESEDKDKTNYYEKEIMKEDIILGKYNFEVLDFILDKDKRTFILECSESVESFCRLEFSCDEVIFCFNDFFSDAWFEVTDNK